MDYYAPLGIIVQRLDVFSVQRPKSYFYDGINAYCDKPLCGITGIPDAEHLQNEYDDWVEYRAFGSIGQAFPEAFYSPRLLKRYLQKCVDALLPIRCLYVEHKGPALWAAEKPSARLMGYEVCTVPRRYDIIKALDDDRYRQYRDLLNQFGLFGKSSKATAFKNAYLSDNADEGSFPTLTVLKVYDIQDISSLM